MKMQRKVREKAECPSEGRPSRTIAPDHAYENFTMKRRDNRYILNEEMARFSKIVSKVKQ